MDGAFILQAVGDGKTDVTEKLQSAINIAVQNNLILVIPQGIYRFTRTLEINQDCLQICGANQAVLLFDNPNVVERDAAAIKINASKIAMTHVILKNNHDREDNRNYYEIGIQIESQASKICLCDVLVSSFNINLQIYEGRERSFVRCRFTQARSAGVYYLSNKISVNDSYIGCCFTGNGWMNIDFSKISGYGNCGVGMYVNACTDLLLQGCHFTYNGQGVYLKNTRRVLIDHCIEEENVRDSALFGNADIIGGIGFDI